MSDTKKLKFEVYCYWADGNASAGPSEAYADSADKVIKHVLKFIEKTCGIADSFDVIFYDEDDNCLEEFQWDNNYLSRNQDMMDDWDSIERDLREVCEKLLEESKSC